MDQLLTDLVDYVCQCATMMTRENRRYVAGKYSMLLEHATPTMGSPLPIGMQMDEMGQCYRNAYHLSRHVDGLTYFEGVAVRRSLGVPLDHAWVVHDDSGRVIDSTWANADEVAYLGVPFERAFIGAHALQAEAWGIFGNHWRAKDSMYHQGVTFDDEGRITGCLGDTQESMA